MEITAPLSFSADSGVSKKFINRLPADQKKAMNLCHVMGKGEEATAKIMKITAKEVRKLCHYAVHTMQEMAATEKGLKWEWRDVYSPGGWGVKGREGFKTFFCFDPEDVPEGREPLRDSTLPPDLDSAMLANVIEWEPLQDAVAEKLPFACHAIVSRLRQLHVVVDEALVLSESELPAGHTLCGKDLCYQYINDLHAARRICPMCETVLHERAVSVKQLVAYQIEHGYISGRVKAYPTAVPLHHTPASVQEPTTASEPPQATTTPAVVFDAVGIPLTEAQEPLKEVTASPLVNNDNSALVDAINRLNGNVERVAKALEWFSR